MYSVIIDKRGGFVHAPRNKITATKNIGYQFPSTCGYDMKKAQNDISSKSRNYHLDV